MPPWLLGGVAILALLVGLGRAPLFDPDEPVYAQAGREMWARGDLVVPRFDGRPWFDKPVLFYAAEALSQGALGPGAAAARLPSVACAAALAALLWTTGRRWFPGAAGGWAALCSLTALYPAVVARAAITDEMFLAALTLGLLGFADLLSDAPRRSGGAAFAAAAAGTALAALTKGPVAPALLGVQCLLYAALSGRPGLLARGRLWAAGACGLLLAAPWYAWMLHAYPVEFAASFFGRQNITRFLAAEHAGRPAWYFLAVLPLAFLPWTLFAPAWLRRARLAPAAPGFRPGLFLWTWAAWVTLFFSLSATKLPTYVLPAVPALCLLAARGLACGGPRLRRAGLLVAGLSAALVAAASVTWAPALSCYYSAAARAADLRAMPAGEPLWIYKGGFPGTLYYAARAGRTAADAAAVRRLLDEGRAFCLLLRPAHAPELSQELSRMEKIPGPAGPFGEGLLLYRTANRTEPH